MIIQRTCHNFLNFTRKNKHSLSRFLSSGKRPLVIETPSHFSNVLVASATALGLSLFIAYKQNAFCENIEIYDSKELNLSTVCDYTYEEAIHKSRDLLQRVKDEVGAPGMVVGVSINGKTVWAEGFGYSDVENRVQCSPNTVMRIASISKSITMAAVAKLWELGKLDLDKPVQEYVPYFPSKTFNGKPVTITCRQLVSHLGGIRHYEKNPKKGENATASEKDKKTADEKDKKKTAEFELEEYYIKENFKDVKSSINLFKDDPLIENPGSKFYYTTHGWTLISAIVEGASKEQFTVHIKKLFKSLGMSSTYLDVNDTLIYHRSRNYIKDKKGRLINAPYVDNSYKWAGGGILSTVGDLLQFGNSMLYSFQYKPLLPQNMANVLSENKQNVKNIDQNIHNISSTETKLVPNKQILPGYLSSKTLEAMWTPVTDIKLFKYGMGWFISPEINECMYCESKKFSVFHTGGAIGASSVLLILPQSSKLNDLDTNFAPRGIIVTILTNLQSVPLEETALKIAENFDFQFNQ